ncbi:MAG: Transposase, partial [uncultured Acetobacteraceae bacterium]
AGRQRGLRRSGYVEAEDLGSGGRGGARRRSPLPRRDRQRARGGRAPGPQARETAPEAVLRLRGRSDRLRAAAPGRRARPRLRRGRAVADPEASGRAGQDQPAGRAGPGQAAPGRRTHAGLGPGPGARGHARVGARSGGGDGGPARQAPAPAVLPAPPWPGVHRPRRLDQGTYAMDVRAGLRASRPAPRAGGIPAGDRGRRGAARALGPAGGRTGPLLVDGAGGRGLPSHARRRLPERGHLRGRDRRRAPLRQPAAAHGLSRPGAVREFDRREGPARRHHQGRQRPGPPRADRRRLDLPLPRADEPAAGRAAGRSAEGRAGDRLEGAGAPLRPLPQAHGPRQAAGRGHHRDRARDGRLPVGDRTRGGAAAARGL